MENSEDIFEEVLNLRCEKKLQEAYIMSLDLVSQDDDLSNLYIASELAVEIYKFDDAIDLSTKIIQQSLSKNNTWYLSTAYLLRAFSYVKTNHYEQAIHDINEACVIEEDGDAGIFWLQNHQEINRTMIINLIGIK